MPRKKIPFEEIQAALDHHEFHPDEVIESDRRKGTKGSTRIMYIENKSGGLAGGNARIGRVSFSKTSKTIYFRNKAFRSLKGGYKANFYDVETGEEYWISGPKKNGMDRLYGERVPVFIDEDVREKYWTEIRNEPERSEHSETW